MELATHPRYVFRLGPDGLAQSVAQARAYVDVQTRSFVLYRHESRET